MTCSHNAAPHPHAQDGSGRCLPSSFGASFERLKELASARQVMVAYLRLKIEEDDWHAVSGAANDLRELDVEMKILREMETK